MCKCAASAVNNVAEEVLLLTLWNEILRSRIVKLTVLRGRCECLRLSCHRPIWHCPGKSRWTASLPPSLLPMSWAIPR